MVKKLVILGLIIICAISIVYAFFMPWAKASASVTKVAKKLTESATMGGVLESAPFAGKFIRGLTTTTDTIAELGDIEVKTMVSGYDIPTLINKQSSKIAIAAGAAIFKDMKDLDKKSMLVYLLPLLALACIGLSIVGLKSKIAVIVMAVLSGAISIGGLYNLMTVDLSSQAVRISIEQGLWQTMYGYLLIFVFSMIWLTLDILEMRKKV